MNPIAHIRIDGENHTEQSVKEHLFGVSEIAAKNASKIGLPKTGELLGLLHDLGKYSVSFQNYIKSATGLLNQDEDDYIDSQGLKGKIDHSTAGAQYVWNEAKNHKLTTQIAAQLLSICIASHHSGLIDCLTPDGENDFIKRISKSYEKTHFFEVIQIAENDIIERTKTLLGESGCFNEIVQFIKSFISNSKSEIITRFQSGLLLRMLFSCLIDADRLDTAKFEKPVQSFSRQNGKYVDWNILESRLEKHYQNFENKKNKNDVDDLRKMVSEACKKRANDQTGVFTLTVPTGGGKTLSSLRFALNHATKHNSDRIIYVIPYTSIIDQNAQAVREILEIEPLEKGEIVLEHHSNLLSENQDWKHKILTENWDTPVVFTTSVQLLDTLFGRGTRSLRRMHQLANSIIIFDEIQTMPIKTIHIFSNAINFLTNYCHSSVVLCTATQPLLNKVAEDKGCIYFDRSNEIIPDVTELFDKLKRVEIKNITKPKGWSFDEMAELANDQVIKSGSCLIVVNTKKSAHAVYSACEKFSKMPVIHLSTSMCPAHRMKRLAEIKRYLSSDIRKPFICVSTQLIEAGVDVDFGTVIRFLAGFDSIAQAAGRCNRNGRNKTGSVFIVNPIEEAIDSLTDIKVGKELTERVLREMDDPESGLPDEFIHPKTIERYFKYYFYNRSSEMVYPVDIGRDDNLLNLLSINISSEGEYFRINGKHTNMYFRQSFKTAAEKFMAIDAQTRGIVVPYDHEGELIISEMFSQFAVEKRFELLKRAQRYTVNVFPNVLKKLSEIKALKEAPEIGVITLSDVRYYHPEFGLSTEITQDYELLNF